MSVQPFLSGETKYYLRAFQKEHINNTTKCFRSEFFNYRTKKKKKRNNTSEMIFILLIIIIIVRFLRDRIFCFLSAKIHSWIFLALLNKINKITNYFSYELNDLVRCSQSDETKIRIIYIYISLNVFNFFM